MSVKFNAAYAKEFIRENDLKGLETQVAAAHKTVNDKSGLATIFWVGYSCPKITIKKNLHALRRRQPK